MRDTQPTESVREELGRLRRQLRRMTERNAVAFDEGFAAATQMVERGADLEQLRGASGVVRIEHDDTMPVELFDGDTDVEIQAAC